ncbi:MAG: HEAT repeat domain-containing protein [Proteobacteria bacterium]|nr:HEAT repeat domain-containing protein [Pseudomonadota bacterium]
MFSTRSDVFLESALVLAAGIALLTLVLLGLIVVMRWRRARELARSQSFDKRWRPVLMAASMGSVETQLPPLAARDRFAFLKLWNYLHESLHGEASQHLNQLARRLKCHETARRMLDERHRATRLLAILTLGHLREDSARHALRSAAASDDTVLSLLAARALIQIDASGGAESLYPLVVSRRDWDIARLTRILAPARDACGTLIKESIMRLGHPARLRALELATALRLDLPTRHLALLMLPDAPPEEIAAALRLVRHPQHLPALRTLLRHADWRVRSESVAAVARLGEAADVRLLAGLLQDEQWWVRYGAAQALAASPLLRLGELDELCAAASPEARGILSHVMAERSLA